VRLRQRGPDISDAFQGMLAVKGVRATLTHNRFHPGGTLVSILAQGFKGVHKADQPLHYGEVMAVWTLMAAAQEGRTLCLTILNHTVDTDLTPLIKRTISDVQEPMIKQLSEVLKDAGIPLPPIIEDPPRSSAEDVPAGAKLREEQIAQILMGKIEAFLFMIQSGLSQALRTDIGTMFVKFQAMVLAEGAQARTVMQDRGWLKVPPLHSHGRLSSTSTHT
jgi:hypothetical protein